MAHTNNLIQNYPTELQPDDDFQSARSIRPSRSTTAQTPGTIEQEPAADDFAVERALLELGGRLRTPPDTAAAAYQTPYQNPGPAGGLVYTAPPPDEPHPQPNLLPEGATVDVTPKARPIGGIVRNLTSSFSSLLRGAKRSSDGHTSEQETPTKKPRRSI
ncbi:unnamed protein product [Clonostachys chloroleuca]|uniref:Uncharacterized protein n=1 Tax=Clonostachys chloroleuca TaxID=1926264 RepID=A0AA35M3G2_9HYPO|nr:unnamed protein product [Clonostachys chloroleuca]